MARRRSSNRITSKNQRNNITTIASRRLLNQIIPRSQRQLLLDIARLSGQDNRTYSPIKKTLRPARNVSGRISSQRIEKRKPLKLALYQFNLPKRVTVCVRRGVRKEVLHALNKTGAGSRSRNRNFNSNSKVKC